MKKIFCEVCEGDLIKEDEFFVCQSCGCKYTVVEVKKLISGGATGNPKNKSNVNKTIDNSEIDLLFKKGIRLYEEGKISQSKNYFLDVIDRDDSNFKAKLYVCLCNAWGTSVDNLKILKEIDNIINLFSEYSKKSGINNEYKENLEIASLQMILAANASILVFQDWMKKRVEEYKLNIKSLMGRTNSYNIQQATVVKNKFDASIKQNQVLFNKMVDTVKMGIGSLIYTLVIDKNVREQFSSDFLQRLHDKYFKLITTEKSADNVNQQASINILSIKNTIESLKKKEIENYWKKNKDLKESFEKKLSENQVLIDDLNYEKKNLKIEKDDIYKKINAPVESKKEYLNAKNLRDDLYDKLNSLGLFKIKEKNLINNEINSLEIKLNELNDKVKQEKKILKERYQKDLNDVNAKLNDVNAKLKTLNSENDEIKNKLENPKYN